MHHKKEMTFKEWGREAGKVLDEAYMAWLLECGSFMRGAWFHWNAQSGYVDIKTGYFVPVGKPKWKKLKL